MADIQVSVSMMDGFATRTIAMFSVTEEGDADFRVAPDPLVIAQIRGAFDALEGKAKGVQMRSVGGRPATKADRARREDGNGKET